MALNLAHLQQHNRSTSSSSSHSASSNLFDLGPAYNPSAAAVFAGRSQLPHARNPSFATTHITTPADSPPDLALGSFAAATANPAFAQQSAFKRPLSAAVARSGRSRAGSSASPYTSLSHTDDFAFTAASSRSSSSSCSESEHDPADSLAMYFNQHHQHPQQFADYSGLFVQQQQQQQQQQQHPQAPFPGINPHQLGPQQFGAPSTLGPLDPSTGSPAFGQLSVSSQAQLEQLAANVRSSTTTTASDRAKQVFVQAWLSANYAPYPDGNVPRQGLYNSYRRVCDFYNIPHINTATLGKAIRLCFPAIKTRRLGVRGNSKYHYCGIRPATVAEAEFLQDFVRRTTNHQAIAASSRRGAAAAAAAAQAGHGSDEEDEGDDSEASSSGGAYPGSADAKDPSPFSFAGGPPSNTPAPLTNVPHPLTLGGGLKSPTLFMLGGDEKTPTTNSLLSAAQAQGLSRVNGVNGMNYGMGNAQLRSRAIVGGTPDQSNSRPGTSSGFAPTAPGPAAVSVRSLPNFPSIEEALGSATKPSPESDKAIEVWRWFEDHLDGLLESVRGFRFDQFELHVRTFWTSLNGDYREVVHAPAVAGLVVRADAVVYDEILEILKTQMLTAIPPQALTGLRSLAEKMEKILLLSLEGYGSTFVEPKVELGARFGHLVLRFLDMFQVTQALTSVLNNAQQVADMRRSWGEIDFESVRNQCALVCNCRHDDLVQLLEGDFVSMLDNLATGTSLEPVREIMNWADLCCERLMSGGEKTMSSRSVLIRWNYVTSQIMRDLTIRSDPAFGAFQILKLFMDDWIALNVLRSVALSTNSVQASVVEPAPVMQQTYLALSPMPGQEFTGPTSAMDHTPTTSSMLAALQDSFNPNGAPGGSQQPRGPHPLANFSTYDVGEFDMSFLSSEATAEAPSPAAQSVGSSASVAELAAGVAAAGVGSDAGGESPAPSSFGGGRRPSDENVDVKREL